MGGKHASHAQNGGDIQCVASLTSHVVIMRSDRPARSESDGVCGCVYHRQARDHVTWVKSRLHGGGGTIVICARIRGARRLSDPPPPCHHLGDHQGGPQGWCDGMGDVAHGQSCRGVPRPSRCRRHYGVGVRGGLGVCCECEGAHLRSYGYSVRAWTAGQGCCAGPGQGLCAAFSRPRAPPHTASPARVRVTAGPHARGQTRRSISREPSGV